MQYKLVIPETGHEFTYAFRWPSASARTKLLKIYEQYQTDIAAARKKYPSVMQAQNYTDEEREQYLIQNPDVGPLGIALDREIKEAVDRVTLRTLKMAISMNGLTPEQRNLVALDVTDEFWQEQNITEAEDAAETFRASVERRRPNYRMGPNVADSEHADSARGPMGGESTDEAAADAVLTGEAASD